MNQLNHKTFKNLEERQKYLAELKKEYYDGIEKATPEDFKQSPIFDLSQEGEIKLTLTKELVEKWGVEKWLANYKKEAQQSTGGIRGPQNILYYSDPRFPLNQLGVALATLGKSLVLKDRIKNREIHKVVAGEVRFNTKKYIELISRIHAANGIFSHLVPENELTAIWLVSFIIFMQDLDGGEYVTSSHAMSSKIATKDVDDQGSQFMPEMSLAFVAKIEEIIKKAKESSAGYDIILSLKNTSYIKNDFNGIAEYCQYLKNGVASPDNLTLIQEAIGQGMHLMYDTVGGCMYKTMAPLTKELGILEAFEWHNKEEDPLFHGVGKSRKLNPKTNKIEYFDLSCDACLPEVVDTMYYEYYLKDKPLGYMVLITDPDGDRLVIGQVEPAKNIQLMEDLGIYYIKINEEKIVSIYNPTMTFLMIMDFNMKQLKKSGRWDNHSRVMLNTTPSSRAWDEWAATHNVKCLTTPVGIKEIANLIKKMEKKYFADPDKEIIMDDIWKTGINLGKDPRVAFAGEESGGMIIGPEEIIRSKNGRQALSMREKSAGEASIIATALASHLYLKKKTLAEYLQEIFKECNMNYRYYERADITYYNESEPDPIKLLKEKSDGELKRDPIDLYYLGLALSLREKKITIDQAKLILSETMPELDFSSVEDIIFVGDATYIAFDKMFVQIRKSGTDAKLRGYSNGNDRKKCLKYLDIMVHYSGKILPLYDQLIPASFRKTIYEKTKKIYNDFLYQGL